MLNEMGKETFAFFANRTVSISFLKKNCGLYTYSYFSYIFYCNRNS